MKERSLEERVTALDTMVNARALLRKRNVDWVPTGPSYLDSQTRSTTPAVYVGEHCALTAMNTYACGHSHDIPRNNLAECMVLDVANKRHRRDAKANGYGIFDTIPEWNDCDDMTKRKVLGVFTAVINKLYNSLPAKERKKWKDKI